MILIVQKQDRISTAGLAIGRQQNTQLAHQRVGGGQGVGGGAGRAGRCALAAAGAQMRIDRHVIARRCDCARRTKVEAAVTAHDLGARMGAQVGGECDRARLVERADEIARLEHRAQHRGRITWVSAQIALAQVRRRKQRSIAGQIDHDVAARHCAVLRIAEFERGARTRQWCGVAVDDQLERAQISGRLPDRPLHDWERRDPGWGQAVTFASTAR